ncbi:hypothetical protein DWX29_03625 [Eubacterium sp. AF19-12LB]|nr:hypothetical protein DWX29_03625 [Eubacterium sp. AF19-12LB]
MYRSRPPGQPFRFPRWFFYTHLAGFAYAMSYKAPCLPFYIWKPKKKFFIKEKHYADVIT